MSDEIEFGSFVLSLAQRRLWHAGTQVQLMPKEAELLALLVERWPNSVSKDEIIERLWPSPASDAALTQTVYRLRRALARFEPDETYVRTIPAVGLQFTSRLMQSQHETPAFAHPLFPLLQRAAFHLRQQRDDSVLEAIRLLERITREDPAFTPAAIALARAYFFGGNRLLVQPHRAYERASSLLSGVLEREPSNAEALAVLTLVLLFFGSDPARVRDAAERALQISPGLAAAHYAAFWERLSRGQIRAALYHANRYAADHAGSQEASSLIGIAMYMSRRYAEAHKHFGNARTFDPLYGMATFYDACAWCLENDDERALSTITLLSGTEMGLRVLGLRGFIDARHGRMREAAHAIEEIERAPVPSARAVAMIHLGIGDVAGAVRSIERACSLREPGLFLVAIDPMYEPLLRSSPGLVDQIQSKE